MEAANAKEIESQAYLKHLFESSHATQAIENMRALIPQHVGLFSQSFLIPLLAKIVSFLFMSYFKSITVMEKWCNLSIIEIELQPNLKLYVELLFQYLTENYKYSGS